MLGPFHGTSGVCAQQVEPALYAESLLPQTAQVLVTALRSCRSNRVVLERNAASVRAPGGHRAQVAVAKVTVT